MKDMIVLLFMLWLTNMIISCGKDSTMEVQHKNKEVIVEVLKAQDFEGSYFCANNSTLELIADFNNHITFETEEQALNSENPENGTFGTHPVIKDKDVVIVEDKLNLTPRNYKYKDNKHNIEEDVNGNDIVGNHRTDVLITLKDNGDLKVKIDIWDGTVNGNLNEIIASREFTCTR